MVTKDLSDRWFNKVRQIDKLIGWRRCARLSGKITFYEDKDCTESYQVAQETETILNQV